MSCKTKLFNVFYFKGNRDFSKNPQKHVKFFPILILKLILETFFLLMSCKTKLVMSCKTKLVMSCKTKLVMSFILRAIEILKKNPQKHVKFFPILILKPIL